MVPQTRSALFWVGATLILISYLLPAGKDGVHGFHLAVMSVLAVLTVFAIPWGVTLLAFPIANVGIIVFGILRMINQHHRARWRIGLVTLVAAGGCICWFAAFSSDQEIAEVVWPFWTWIAGIALTGLPEFLSARPSASHIGPVVSQPPQALMARAAVAAQVPPEVVVDLSAGGHQRPAAAPERMALRVMTGPLAGHEFDLDDGELWIGAHPNNQVCLAGDSAVSGHHACIRSSLGRHRLYDNDSLNGTLVNSRRIGHDVAELARGDRISIGKTQLRVDTPRH